MKGEVFFDSQNILWKWMTTCSNFGQLQRDRGVLKSEAGRRRGHNGSLLAEVASVGPATLWQPDRPVVWSCTYGMSVFCMCVSACVCVRWNLWDREADISVALSSSLDICRTLPPWFATITFLDLDSYKHAGLAFHSLPIGWMCPIWSDQSFHCWLMHLPLIVV